MCESSLGSLGRRQELDRAAREQQAADGIPLRKQREVVGPGGATDPAVFAPPGAREGYPVTG